MHYILMNKTKTKFPLFLKKTFQTCHQPSPYSGLPGFEETYPSSSLFFPLDGDDTVNGRAGSSSLTILLIVST